ncbi:MAG: DUF262 domain-containing protein, partial [Phycisphaerae bacterium]
MPKLPQSLFEITGDDRTHADAELRKQQRSVEYDSKEFTVEILVHKFANDDIFIPDYQRDLVWTEERQSKFVESVLLGLPIPYLFGADNTETGQIEIVDGAQRLYTLRRFLEGELRLSGLEKLTFVSNFQFGDLTVPQQRRFKNRTLRMVVLSPHADKNTRFDIFERINTGSLLLVASELRRGAFPGPFYDLVRKCAEEPKFVSLCPVNRRRRQRGEHEELVLRYFAYAQRYRQFQHDVTRFLNDYLVSINQRFTKTVQENDFHRMINFVNNNFPYGFAKSRRATTTPRVRFEAISVGAHVALTARPHLRRSDME